MSETDLAAPSEAAEEVVAKADVTAPQTEGQAQDDGQPAEVAEQPAPEDETESKRRRERRERARERAEQEAERARQAEDRLNRIRRAAESQSPPREADFPDPIEYAAARGAFAQAQAAARFQQGEAEAEAQAAREAAQAANHARIADRQRQLSEDIGAARTIYTDFDQALAVAQRGDVVSVELSLQVLESDKAADLTYWLGKNPTEAQRLSSMFARNPIAAAMELGRIEAGLSRPKPRTQTTAPEPVTPVRGTARATPNPTAMSHSEYRAWREAGGKF